MRTVRKCYNPQAIIISPSGRPGNKLPLIVFPLRLKACEKSLYREHLSQTTTSRKSHSFDNTCLVYTKGKMPNPVIMIRRVRGELGQRKKIGRRCVCVRVPVCVRAALCAVHICKGGQKTDYQVIELRLAILQTHFQSHHVWEGFARTAQMAE